MDAEAVVFEFVGPDNVLMTGILQELLDGLVAEGEGVWAPVHMRHAARVAMQW